MQRKASSTTGRLMEPLLHLSASGRRDSGANRRLAAEIALRDFLDQVKNIQEDIRKDSHRQASYQVFFSYAWSKAEDPAFKGLKSFLRRMQADMVRAGIEVWFDEKRMTGDVNAQMHHGIAQSDLVLLFGTDVYRSKTQADSKTNVKKELDFALEKMQQGHPGLLKPLLLEGTFKETFSAPGLNGYTQLMVDATWVDLAHDTYDMQKYIKALTTYDQEVGIIPVALGLPQAAQKYRSHYQLAEQILQTELDRIYAAAPLQPEEKELALNELGDALQKETLVELQAKMDALEKKQKDLLASTVYKKLPAVKNEKELEERIQKFIALKNTQEEIGAVFPLDQQAHLDVCHAVAKELPELEQAIQATKERMQLLEDGPFGVNQGNIKHTGDVNVDESINIGHETKGRAGPVRQGNIEITGNFVSQSGGFRLGHSA
ncbi:MAG: hypothetical protein K0S27_1634 [Gammaproteobacteria bacterium]|jgi:hypothetical protein|nr:hypothetical protein [Gammaproteobacteria bacterium]